MRQWIAPCSVKIFVKWGDYAAACSVIDFHTALKKCNNPTSTPKCTKHSIFLQECKYLQDFLILTDNVFPKSENV